MQLKVENAPKIHSGLFYDVVSSQGFDCSANRHY